MTGQKTTVKQAWRHAEIHEHGLAVKRLTKGFPHGCMAGSIFIFYDLLSIYNLQDDTGGIYRRNGQGKIHIGEICNANY